MATLFTRQIVLFDVLTDQQLSLIERLLQDKEVLLLGSLLFMGFLAIFLIANMN